MFATQSKAINGIEVKVTQFPALEALRIQALLLRLLGPAVGRFIGAVRGSVGNFRNFGDLQVDGPALASAISDLMDKLPEEQLVAVIQRLLQGTLCVVADKGQKIAVGFSEPDKFDNAFSLVFQGRTMTVYNVLAFVIQVNFPDFFGTLPGIGGLLGGMLGLKKAENDANGSSSPSGPSAA